MTDPDRRALLRLLALSPLTLAAAPPGRRRRRTGRG